MTPALQLGVLALETTGAVALRRLRHGPLHPAWSVRAELIATLVRRLMERSRVHGPQWLRAAQAALPNPLPPDLRELRVEPAVADGVPCRWIRPANPAAGVPDRAVVYVHGGGYVSGTFGTHRDVAGRIAVGTGVPVLFVEYRLAPEHRFPAAHDDCLRAVRWLRGLGVPPARTAFAGDSAGGALAAATMLALRDAGEPLPAAAALLCPWVDPMAGGGSMVANDRYDMIGHALLTTWARMYAGDADIAGPRLALGAADLRGLPPLLVQVGELEVLHDQILAFAERARVAGVNVTVDAHAAMIHDFQVLATLLPEGMPGIRTLVEFLARALPASETAHHAAG